MRFRFGLLLVLSACLAAGCFGGGDDEQPAKPPEITLRVATFNLFYGGDEMVLATRDWCTDPAGCQETFAAVVDAIKAVEGGRGRPAGGDRQHPQGRRGARLELQRAHPGHLALPDRRPRRRRRALRLRPADPLDGGGDRPTSTCLPAHTGPTAPRPATRQTRFSISRTASACRPSRSRSTSFRSSRRWASRSSSPATSTRPRISTGRRRPTPRATTCPTRSSGPSPRRSRTRASRTRTAW